MNARSNVVGCHGTFAALFAGLLFQVWTCLGYAEPPLTLQPGDRVCLVGNALGEGLQHHPEWEARLHVRFPRHQLVVRNLCFPGDEPDLRRRIQNFGEPDAHLAHSRADVVLFFFGLNESFRDVEGRALFEKELAALIEHTKLQRYNRDTAPRMVLVSPIAVEGWADSTLPDAAERNKVLSDLVAEMRGVADRAGIGFADVFEPTRTMFAESTERLTLNSIHLNDLGHQRFAVILNNALFGADTHEVAVGDALRTAIADKNFHWWHRYRAVNGYSIYGERGEAGSDGTYNNRDVMERERQILDQMCVDRDQRIWSIARGDSPARAIDDSQTLEFLPVKSTVSGNPEETDASATDRIRYLSATAQLATFKVAEGFEIGLVASEEMFPELANPVALNFDDRGRLWVAVMPCYPQWQPTSKLNDKLLILDDVDRDGRADTCTVFAGGLHQPTGFELSGNAAFVACQPDLLELRDTNGDDHADTSTRRLVGFCTADSHHGLGSLQWDAAGNLYLLEGLFKRTTLETPYGPQRNSDTAVWRWNPRTESAVVHSSFPLTNPWGLVFDEWGQGIVANGTSSWHYWLTPISGRMNYPDKHAWTWQDDDGNQHEYPQFVPHVARPCSSTEIVSSRNFPEDLQGHYLVNNVIGIQGTLRYRVTDSETGAGYQSRYDGPFLESSDPNFRPSHLQFGPDGALYIADWHNALIGHLQHNLRDPNRDHTHGRIWRVHFKDRPLVPPPQIVGATEGQLLQLLREHELRTRYRIRRTLAARPTAEVVEALGPFVETARQERDERLLLESLWLHQAHQVPNIELLSELLGADDFRVRAAATRVIGDWRVQLTDPLAILRRMVNDPHPRVRVEAIRACSQFESAEALDVALEALEHDMSDPYVSYTLEQTLRVLQ